MHCECALLMWLPVIPCVASIKCRLISISNVINALKIIFDSDQLAETRPAVTFLQRHYDLEMSSICFDEPWSPWRVCCLGQEQLDHSSIVMSVDIYDQLILNSNQQAVARFDDAKKSKHFGAREERIYLARIASCLGNSNDEHISRFWFISPNGQKV